MALSSSDINLMVYRYLQESGFSHTAFAFAYESQICSSPTAESGLPPGALVSIIQKGLQYMDLESHLEKDGGASEDFDTSREIKAATKSPRKRPAWTRNVEIKERDVVLLEGHQKEVFTCAWNPRHEYLASGSGDSTARIWNVGAGTGNGLAYGLNSVDAKDNPPPRKRTNNHTSNNSASTSRSSAVTSPRTPTKTRNCFVLPHDSKGSTGAGDTDGKNSKSKDVTTLDWKHDGTALATGCYDGRARIWSKGASLIWTLDKHKGPVFALKWNTDGTYLLSGSVDNTAIVWDTETGIMKQQFEFHTAPILDVNWMDNETFATCSIDTTVQVCRVGSKTAIRTFKGHLNEVNAIQWSPYVSSKQVLASCSDDHTAKIWCLDQDKCIHTLSEHKKEIFQIKWCPKPNAIVKSNSSDNSGQICGFLATASFDKTIKLWNVATGECHFTLERHRCPVYTLAFHPSGEYLASGSFDRCLNIWSMEDGVLVKKYQGDLDVGGIFEVCWNRTGSKVAACFSNKKVVIVEFQM